jgi:hypothetical protein
LRLSSRTSASLAGSVAVYVKDCLDFGIATVGLGFARFFALLITNFKAERNINKLLSIVELILAKNVAIS